MIESRSPTAFEARRELHACSSIAETASECDRRLARALVFALDPLTRRAIVAAMRHNAELRAAVRRAGQFAVANVLCLDAGQLRPPATDE